MDHDGFARLLLQPDLARVLAALDGRGEETRVVGGAVRNALLGIDVDDVDLATTAEPATVSARARDAGLATIPTGIAHGTVTVLANGKPFEVTTLRRDVETDGRHAVVAFGRSFDDDAWRRDFTMNALSVSCDGALHDPVGGLTDLRARRVRFIGDAASRIREDYLRILRFFRFHATYGEGDLDPQARDAAVAGRNGLLRLSAERLNKEITKLLVAPRAVEVVEEIAGTGILDPVLGGVVYPSRFAKAVAVAHACGAEVGPAPRLLALAVATREDAARLRTRLRLSNATTKRLDEAVAILERFHACPMQVDDVNTLLFRHGARSSVRDALVVLHAQDRADPADAGWRALHDHAAQAPIPALPVSGDDLLGRGVAPGRTVGAALKRLQALWIRAGFPQDPATIARLVEKVVVAPD